MGYYLYRNPVSQNLDNFNVTNLQILKVVYFKFYLGTFCCICGDSGFFPVKWKFKFSLKTVTWTYLDFCITCPDIIR